MGRAVKYHYRELSQATGAIKPSESQKSESPLNNERGQAQGEEYYDPARKDNILRRNKTRLELCEEHLKDPIIVLDKALKCLENPYSG